LNTWKGSLSHTHNVWGLFFKKKFNALNISMKGISNLKTKSLWGNLFIFLDHSKVIVAEEKKDDYIKLMDF